MSIGALVASVAAAHWLSALQALSFVDESKALPVGVFATSEDEAALSALESEARWTSRLIVSDSGVTAAIALTSPADIFSAPYSLGGDNSLGPGSLPNGARVYFELPQEKSLDDSAGTRPIEPLDLSADLGNSEWCARWTMEDGSEGSVAPVVDTLDGWRTRMVCTIPPIEQFRSIEIGASVQALDSYAATLVGRGSVFVASLVIPITSPTDTTKVPDDAGPQPLRAETYASGEVQIWGADSDSAKEGRPYEKAVSLVPGDVVQIMFFNSSAYAWSTTLIQAAWVFVGLAGGWAGVALYRLLRGPSPENSNP